MPCNYVGIGYGKPSQHYDQESHDLVPPHDLDQPSLDTFPSHISSIIGSYSGIGRGVNCLEDCEVVVVREEIGNLISSRTVREHVINIIKSHFEQHLVMEQAQILHGLIKHKKMKHTTKLLGFQDAKTKTT